MRSYMPCTNESLNSDAGTTACLLGFLISCNLRVCRSVQRHALPTQQAAYCSRPAIRSRDLLIHESAPRDHLAPRAQRFVPANGHSSTAPPHVSGSCPGVHSSPHTGHSGFALTNPAFSHLQEVQP